MFDRAPDEGGFNAFLTEMRLGNLGVDMAKNPNAQQEAVIEQFVESVEFQNTYGELSNRAFIEQLYLNILDREGDMAGLNAFTAALDAGAENGGLTRTEVVTELANSPEFVNLLALPSAAFATNVTIHPAEGQVFRLYQAVFDRAPDVEGFTAFVNSIQNNIQTVETIITEFVDSPEFLATYGEDLTDEAFVDALFANVLPGNTDPIGRAAFTEALETGTSRAAVVAELSESPELRNSTAEAAEAFVSTVFTGSDDILDGGTDNDVLFGGRGSDEFVFDTEVGDQDTILDFTTGTDTINLGSNDAFDSFVEIIAVGAQIGQDTVFDFGGGNTLTLNNTILIELTADDFDISDDVMAMSDAAIDVLI